MGCTCTRKLGKKGAPKKYMTGRLMKKKDEKNYKKELERNIIRKT